jgi:hypothetical protein
MTTQGADSTGAKPNRADAGPFVTIAHYTTTADQRRDFLNLLNSRGEILAQLGYMPAEPIQVFADVQDPNTMLEIITWTSEMTAAEAAARPEIKRIDNALRAMLAAPGAMGVEHLRRG